MREHGLKLMGWAPFVASAACALGLAGCVTTPPRATTQPAPVAAPAPRAVVVAASPAPVAVVRPAVQEQIVAGPNDVYISAALDTDIVFEGGSTFIWFVGPDGHRHRHFYGHGDHRQEIFRRRDNLRSVAHRAGPPPMHVMAHDPHGRLDAIRRDQIRHEQQARMASAHGPDHHGFDTHANMHRAGGTPDRRYASAAAHPGSHLNSQPVANRGLPTSQGRAVHEASAEHPGSHHPGDVNAGPQGVPPGKS
jgi:hypothetical protein